MIIKHGVSHVDHGLTASQLIFICKRFQDRRAFFIEELELPKDLGTVACALYGPAMGDDPITEDEVVYRVREGRKWTSRMAAPHVFHAKRRRSRKIVVIGGPNDNDECVLYTAYGGPLAPREPGDLTISSWEELLSSRKFWSEHCLAE
jgi:hypothetical protein